MCHLSAGSYLWPFLKARALRFYLLHEKGTSGQFKFDLKLPWYCLSLWMGYAVRECSCFLFTHFSLSHRRFFIFLSLARQLLVFRCPWHSFVPMWLYISLPSLQHVHNKQSGDKQDFQAMQMLANSIISAQLMIKLHRFSVAEDIFSCIYELWEFSNVCTVVCFFKGNKKES